MKKSLAGSMSDWSGLLKDLFRQIDDGTITRDQLHMFVARHENPFNKEINLLTVDYSRILKRMIATGKYDWVNRDITEKNYPLPTSLLGQKILIPSKLFHFNREISTKEASAEMNKVGSLPAN